MRWLVLSAAVVTAGASLLAFGTLLWRGAPGWVDLGLAPAAALSWDAALSLLFFAQHSGMVRRGVRRWVLRVVPVAYGGALYTIVSGVALLATVALWQDAGGALVVAEGAWGRAVRALFLLVGVAMLGSALSLPGFDLLGLRPLRRGNQGTEGGASAGLVRRGAYGWVRHPLYALSIVLLWAHPAPSPDRLLLAALWTAWIVVAIRWEEADLVAELGSAYRDYQQAVPMLVPRLRRPAR